MIEIFACNFLGKTDEIFPDFVWKRINVSYRQDKLYGQTCFGWKIRYMCELLAFGKSCDKAFVRKLRVTGEDVKYHLPNLCFLE